LELVRLAGSLAKNSPYAFGCLLPPRAFLIIKTKIESREGASVPTVYRGCKKKKSGGIHCLKQSMCDGWWAAHSKIDCRTSGFSLKHVNHSPISSMEPSHPKDQKSSSCFAWPDMAFPGKTLAPAREAQPTDGDGPGSAQETRRRVDDRWRVPVMPTRSFFCTQFRDTRTRTQIFGGDCLNTPDSWTELSKVNRPSTLKSSNVNIRRHALPFVKRTTFWSSRQPQKAIRGGIPCSFLEPFARSWSHFVGICRQKLSKSWKIDF